MNVGYAIARSFMHRQLNSNDTETLERLPSLQKRVAFYLKKKSKRRSPMRGLFALRKALLLKTAR